jgi:hypothetical protein
MNQTNFRFLNDSPLFFFLHVWPGYPIKTAFTETWHNLPGDLTIRECIEFSFYNWISWACHAGYSRGVAAVKWIRKR